MVGSDRILLFDGMNFEVKVNRNAKRYSRKELCYRILWGVGRQFFRLTPRPCFGIRRSILRLFGAKVGRRVHIYSSSHIYLPWELTIGDDSAIGEWALIYNLGKVTVGERTIISQRTHLCAGTHDYKDPTMPLIKTPIQVGSDVWICADAFVGPNVKIEDGSIVAARAVVVKDVDHGEIVGGNPAKLIKSRD
jgi:putative colanic acid biosynthesis acetyltransferase WcaF